MTDVNVSFSLDCNGDGHLTLNNLTDQQLNAGYETNVGNMGPFTVPAHVSLTKDIHFGNVTTVSGFVKGTFADGGVPHWHPSANFTATKAESCGTTTTTSSTLPGIVPGGPTTTTPPTTSTTVPVVDTTVVASTTTTASPIPVVTTQVGPPRSTPTNLPVTGGIDATFVGMGVVLLAVGSLARWSASRRRS